MLHLYQFEACPYCAKVRHVLDELELDYMCHTVHKGSEKRTKTFEEFGVPDQVPFLVDEERDVKMHESDAIIEHLREHYDTGN